MRVGGELQHIRGPLAAIMEDLERRIVKMEPKPEEPPDEEPGPGGDFAEGV